VCFWCLITLLVVLGYILVRFNDEVLITCRGLRRLKAEAVRLATSSGYSRDLRECKEL